MKHIISYSYRCLTFQKYTDLSREVKKTFLLIFNHIDIFHIDMLTTTIKLGRMVRSILKIGIGAELFSVSPLQWSESQQLIETSWKSCSFNTRKIQYEHFTPAFWLHNNFWKFSALEHKFKRWFCSQKHVLNVRFKYFGYTK